MVYVINPIDPTIKSLRRLCHFFLKWLPEISVVYIFPGEHHKKNVHSLLRNMPDNTSIIFMGHGRSDALFGSKGKYWNAFEIPDYVEYPEQYENDENFINADSFNLLKGKLLIIYACNSTELAKTLLRYGSKVVLGFYRLPTSKEEFFDDWHIRASSHLIAAINGCLNIAFRNTILRSVKEHLAFSDIESLMRMELQRQIVHVLTSNARYKYDLANVLSHIKLELKAIGDRSLKLN